MSAISYAMNELYHVIDKSLLEQAYVNTSAGTAICPFAGLDQIIIDTTVYGRVMADINVFGGMQKQLCSAHGEVIHQDNWGTVFHYSDEAMNGHVIMSVNSFFPGMTCLDGLMGNSGCAMSGYPFPLSGLQTNATSMAASLQRLSTRLAGNMAHGPQAIVTPRIVAHNSIMIERARLPNPIGIFKVIVSHDDALNDISPKAWPAFSQLVTAAVKAHLYQTLRSRIMKGALYYGQEYTIYTEILQEFVDAEEQYKEMRARWAKVAFTNDKTRYSSFIRSMTRSL